jgi:glycosyltransferase involved in cell wall biosynthesis
MVIQRLRPLFSGQGVQVEVLCRELARRGLSVTIVTAGHGPNPRWEHIGGYRVRRLRADVPGISRWLPPGRFRSQIFGLRILFWLLLHGWRTQVIHAHAQSDALYTAWLFSRLRRLPLIFEMTLLGADDAGAFAVNSNRLSRLRNAVFRRCDGFVAISPALAHVYETSSLPPQKLRLIPQAVDVTDFHPADDAHDVRRRLSLPDHGPVTVFVGSLVERKGLDVLLAAWEQIHLQHADATLLLVGLDRFDDDPAAAAFLDEHLGRLPEEARNRIVRLGLRDDVAECLRAADVFVFPSRREGFGTVMIEAMATGLACVVAELPDITDFIFDTEGKSGVVVAQNDAGALAREVSALLSDPARAESIGQAALRRAHERFSVQHIADDYIVFYAELAGGKRHHKRRRTSDSGH